MIPSKQFRAGSASTFLSFSFFCFILHLFCRWGFFACRLLNPKMGVVNFKWRLFPYLVLWDTVVGGGWPYDYCLYVLTLWNSWLARRFTDGCSLYSLTLLYDWISKIPTVGGMCNSRDVTSLIMNGCDVVTCECRYWQRFDRKMAQLRKWYWPTYHIMKLYQSEWRSSSSLVMLKTGSLYIKVQLWKRKSVHKGIVWSNYCSLSSRKAVDFSQDVIYRHFRA